MDTLVKTRRISVRHDGIQPRSHERSYGSEISSTVNRLRRLPRIQGNERPWLNNNPATPNPAFFSRVDAVLKLAQENDLHLLIGIYHQKGFMKVARNTAIRSRRSWCGGRRITPVSPAGFTAMDTTIPGA